MVFKNVATFQIRTEKGRKDVERMFLNAVVIGNIVTARSCLQKGVNPNVLSSDGLSPLHISAERDDVAMGRLLMNSKNIQLNLPMQNGDTPLIHATRFRCKNFVKLLLNIQTSDYDARASVGQSFSMADKVSKHSLAEKTALHVAAILGELEIIQDLIQGGADVNVADAFGNTPLMYCALDHPDPHITRLLLSKEVALNCNSSVLLEMMHILLDYGMDINIVNPVTQYTALHMVGISGYVPLAELLLSRNANIYAHDCLGRTPYDVAVMHEQKDLIKLYKNWMKGPQEKDTEKEKKTKKKLTFAT